MFPYIIGILDSIKAGTPYFKAVEANSPVAYYRLGDSSTTMTDYMGSYDGTHTSVTVLQDSLITNSSSNKSVRYTGTSSYSSVATNTNFQAAKTIEFIIKPNTLPTGNPQFIVGCADATSSYNGFRCVIDSNGSIDIGVKDGTTLVGSVNSGAVGVYLNVGQVYHVAAVISGYTTSDTIKLYIDDTLVNESSTFSATWSIGAYALRIGQALDSYWTDFNGFLDEVAIYTTALSAANITSHFTAGGFITSSTNILAIKYSAARLWRLGESGAATTAVDETGNGDGTYINSPTLGAASLMTLDTTDTAVTFSGTNQRVNFNPVFANGSTAGFTIFMKVKATSLPATLYYHGEYGEAFASINASGNVSASIKQSDTAFKSVTNTNYTITTSSINAICIRWEKGVTISAYVNTIDTVASTAVDDLFLFNPGPSSTYQGQLANIYTSSGRLTGTMDEVLFFTSALSTDAITEILKTYS